MEIKTLEDWRKAHYWSLGTLAREAKIDKGVISRLEAGKANCRLETAKKISEALSVRPEQITEFRKMLGLNEDLDTEADLAEDELAELLERIEINEGKPGIPHDQAVAEFSRFYDELLQKRSHGGGIKASA
jgi:predicted transcriptional regulator